MSSDADPAELEGRRQREADKLEERSKQLAQDVEDTSQDWQRKRRDEGVPGAPPPEGEDEERDEEDSSEREDEEDSSEGEDEERDKEDSSDGEDGAAGAGDEDADG